MEDEQAKDGCMENKQVKDAAEDALGLDLTDMAKMYPGGFLLELSETIDGIEQTLQYSIEERNELFWTLQRIIAGKDCMKILRACGTACRTVIRTGNR